MLKITHKAHLGTILACSPPLAFQLIIASFKIYRIRLVSKVSIIRRFDEKISFSQLRSASFDKKSFPERRFDTAYRDPPSVVGAMSGIPVGRGRYRIVAINLRFREQR